MKIRLLWLLWLVTVLLVALFGWTVDRQQYAERNLPKPVRPSCQLGLALEVVDGQQWWETVVVCKGPQGEPIVLKNEFFVRVDSKRWAK